MSKGHCAQADFRHFEPAATYSAIFHNFPPDGD
jgi:hypothetical protein